MLAALAHFSFLLRRSLYLKAAEHRLVDLAVLFCSFCSGFCACAVEYRVDSAHSCLDRPRPETPTLPHKSSNPTITQAQGIVAQSFSASKMPARRAPSSNGVEHGRSPPRPQAQRPIHLLSPLTLMLLALTTTPMLSSTAMAFQFSPFFHRRSSAVPAAPLRAIRGIETFGGDFTLAPEVNVEQRNRSSSTILSCMRINPQSTHSSSPKTDLTHAATLPRCHAAIPTPPTTSLRPCWCPFCRARR